ncbi:MAG TPA: hypothetical protein VGI73_05140 [Solirubrobacterales bacterium]
MATTTSAKTAGSTASANPGSDSDASPARAAGRRACRGLSPLEGAHRFEDDARRAGVRRAFIAEVSDPTLAVEESAGYPALVAALYATTQPERVRRGAAAGCAEELAAH